MNASSCHARWSSWLLAKLATTTLTWAGEIAPHAENAALLLADAAGLPAPPTLLTGKTRRGARPATDTTRPFSAPRPAVARTCQDCGEIIHGGKRCRSCHQAANTNRLRKQQGAEGLRRRATDEHPS